MVCRRCGRRGRLSGSPDDAIELGALGLWDGSISQHDPTPPQGRPTVRPVRARPHRIGRRAQWKKGRDEAQETLTRRRKPAVRQHSARARTDIGERARELRQARGLSQRQAGGELISPSSISRLESGERLLDLTVLKALTLSMPDVRFVIEAGELRIEEMPRPTE